ncbi:MAG: RING finger domain-containing protein [Parachlamydiales bacterium]|jgi:hypothetical protein
MQIETCSFPSEKNKFNLEQCPHCLEDFKQADEITVLACNHILHKTCFEASDSLHFQCSVCKRPYWIEDLFETKFKGKSILNVLHECALQILMPQEDTRKEKVFIGIKQPQIEALVKELLKRIAQENIDDQKIDFCLSKAEEQMDLEHSMKNLNLQPSKETATECWSLLDSFFDDVKYEEICIERNQRLVKRITKKVKKLPFYNKFNFFETMSQNEQDRLLAHANETALGKEIRRWSYVREGITLATITLGFIPLTAHLWYS